MELKLEAEKPPIRITADGVAEVGATRVSLDLVLDYYDLGVPPDEIARQHDTLELANVYGAIAYYLRHKDEVDAYRDEQRRLASKTHAEMERLFPSTGLRERLLERQRQRATR